jgi:hypothetical protein
MISDWSLVWHSPAAGFEMVAYGVRVRKQQNQEVDNDG